jgi:hypothetical protein
MKALTISFMQQCWGEGVYGSVKPTHIRLNVVRFYELKALFKTAKYGGAEPMTIDNMVFNNAQLVFTSEVDEDTLDVVNIRHLRPVYSDAHGALQGELPKRLTFSKQIEGEEICSCCGHKLATKIEIYSPPEAMWHCDDCGHEGLIAATTTKEQALAIHAVGSPDCKAHSFWTKKR